MTGGGKNKIKRKINHFYFYFVLPKVKVGSPVKHFLKNKRPKRGIEPGSPDAKSSPLPLRHRGGRTTKAQYDDFTEYSYTDSG